MNIIFMGTPAFACPSLESLVTAGHKIVGVVTRPDKPVGRGRKVSPTPVKLVAEQHGLTVLQPAKVNAPEAVSQLRALKPSVVVVVAFGAILRKPLLTLAPLGAVNLHASLLPAYRGVAPVQWCLIHGERTTGVTTMLMDEGVDTGPVLEKRVLEIHPGETAGELLDRLAEVGGPLLVDSIRGLENRSLTPMMQGDSGASYAPGLEKEHGFLDFSRPARTVVNQFRGVTPAPGARAFLGDQAILVRQTRLVSEVGGVPYTILEIEGRHLRVAAGNGAVDLITVRPPGKKDMEGSAFARGRRLRPGDTLSPPPTLVDLSLRIAVPG